MRNKGAIQLVAILFAVFSLFHLSFSWVTSKVEKDAKEYAKGDATKELAYLDSISNEPVYNFLWIKKFKYKECTDREMNFGLDLKGGMNVMLEVSVADLVNALANNNPDPTFQKALHKAMDNEKTTDVDFISLFEKEFLAADPNAKLAGIFSTPKLKDKVSYQSTNDEVISVLREEAAVAFDNSFKILRTRIDRFGVTQPNIQRQGLENSSRILVELPGVKDRERVRKLLQGSANLEFWETFDNAEIFSLLMEANTSIAKFNEASTSPANVAANDSTAVLTDSTAASASADTALSKSLVQQLKVDSVDNGLDKFRSSNPLFAALNPSVSQEGKPYEGATVGTANKKDTALVMKYLNRPEIRMIFPRELNFAWEVKSIVDEKQRETGFFRLIALKGSKQKGGPVLEGDVVTDAREQIDPVSSQVEVSMSMNGAGAADWARITRENTGHQVAIVLDGYVYSAPRVNGEIKGGNSSISGSFTLTEAKDLANILQSGKLPAPARILQQEIVGPTLGAESISAGLLSFVIAFLVVLAYMVFYYNKAGWVANFALIVNVFFIFGVLASLNAVLTLPGIAGIVLTIGMAVDANVLIFERIREELAAGKSLSSAIADGFSNALSAIVDANVTTLITAIILYMFGSGPVQGFATTLGIGILTSLFAAIFISRLVIDSMLKRKKEITFSTKFSERAFKNVNFKFLQFRKT
ncbi:MAG: Protein translocase subunit SecDF, partial [Bacteroidota bacterium]